VNLARLRATVDGDSAYEFEPSDFAAQSSEGTANQRWEELVRTLALEPGDDSGRTRHEVVVDGWRFVVTVESAARAALRERADAVGAGTARAATDRIRAQLPGRIVAVFVAPGDAVTVGQRLVALEAMKMENEVRAPRAGTIARMDVRAGDRVELGDELLVIE
jgi:oxaloacetate decarboxylase (Na+ extruding) subunit alpha